MRRPNLIGLAQELGHKGESLRPTFCLETACWAFNCSYLVYYDEPASGLASEMKHQDLLHCRLKLRKFIPEKMSGSYAAIFTDRVRPGRIFLAFRGTSSLNDVATDIKAWANLEEFVQTGNHESHNFWVHTGFHDSYKMVGALARMALEEYISRLINSGMGCGRISVTLCGHSLGGALATLMAVHSVDWLQSKGVTRLSLYTFGAPRVGDANFAAYADSRIANMFRIIGSADPIPRMPGKKAGILMLCLGLPLFLKIASIASRREKGVLLVYRHVGYEVVMNCSLAGDLIVNPRASDYTFFLKAQAQPIAHLLPKYRTGLLASVWQLRGDDAMIISHQGLETE